MSTSTRWRIEQEEAVGASGMVSAKHPLSAQAGADILRAGGNAVDAAVATAFAESVVNPAMTGIGGGGNMVIFLAERGETVAIEYGMRSPASVRPDMYELLPGYDSDGFGWRNTKGEANLYGYSSIAVPGTVAGLCLALERYGRLPRAEVMAPAIQLARDGFDVSFYDVLMIGREMHRIRQFPATCEIFLKPYQNDWAAPSPETPDRIVQRDLADTLELIARNGRDGFYSGDVAAMIDHDMREHGGCITAQDLNDYAPRVSTPGFVARYRDHGILTAPWGNGGITVLQTLNILKGYDLARLGHNSAPYLHAFIEATRRAYADRFAHVADPDTAEVAWQGLMSDEYADVRRKEITPASATPRHAAGDPWQFQSAPSGKRTIGKGDTAADHQTTHMSTLDRDGNAVSVTQTLMSAFGSRVITKGTGVVFNNGMMWFDPEPGHANSIAPNKRPLSNMCPLIAFKDGQARLSVGASGGRKIINCVTQIVLNVLDHGMNIQDAISAPRIDCSTATNLIDDRISASVVADLAERGHETRVRGETFTPHLWASPVGIAVSPDGQRHGGVHRFYPAKAVGVD